MAKKKILFAAFEAVPFVKTGGLGDVAGSLPGSIKSDEYDIRVILPLLSAIPDKYREKMKFVKHYQVQVGWRSQYCGLFKMRKDGVTYYFLDSEYYFKRYRIYGEDDDPERVAFFSKAVLETIVQIQSTFMPDIIHANDWHTALIPVFLKAFYTQIPGFDKIKTIITIHNLKFQGQYGGYVIDDVLGLYGNPIAGTLEYYGDVNFMKSAIILSDLVTTVSPTYADNICTWEYGEGLDGLFNEFRYKLRGIINGIDYNDLDPMTDPALVEHFDVNSLEKKGANKRALQEALGLPQDESKPLFAIVSRLTAQKGMDMICEILPELAKRDMQLAVLGTGDWCYEDCLGRFGYENSGMASVRIDFDEPLSRKFYGGADVFLMPSRFEPCGLAQMMSMRYGTLPLVRSTGGLADTVDGYSEYGSKANGFSFNNAWAGELLGEIDNAIDLFKNHPRTWKTLQKNGMNRDFSWPKSAEEYKKIYDELVSK